ncbi:MAG: cytochrome c biogenesis protein ResB [Deltaproteobacteria bacterium]|nr:cytochrome c biogenesis protein ResB [Deltaproteobacteria bacterium]
MKGFLQRGGLFFSVVLIVSGLLVGITAYLTQDASQRRYEDSLLKDKENGNQGWSKETVEASVRRDRDQAAIYVGFFLAFMGGLAMLMVLRHRSVTEMVEDLEQTEKEDETTGKG